MFSISVTVELKRTWAIVLGVKDFAHHAMKPNKSDIKGTATQKE